MLPSPFNSQFITSEYGPRDIGFHTGTDWGRDAGAHLGARILASGPGLVTFSGWNGARPGYVKTVHYDGTPYSRAVMHCHLESVAGAPANVRVVRGSTIGYVGNSGSSTGPHLHAELIGGGDPMKLLFDRGSSMVGGAPAGIPEQIINTKEWDEMATKAEVKQAVLEALQSRPDTVIIHYGVGSRNGIVLAAPGFWHKFTAEQWTQFVNHGLRTGIREIVPVNDRDYDVIKEIYTVRSL